VSTERVVTAIRDCARAGAPLRVSGGGSWLDAGRPVEAERLLPMREDSGVVSYVPGDLTLTVRAGATLSEIDAITHEHDQWLPLDPYGSPDGTIGATLSTASAGPLASSFGLPRDLVLGIEFVTGRGEVVRAGGKVVKNVAGFDLSRLLVGSWGTLGVITEVTLRLYARPAVDRTFAIELAGNEGQITAIVRAIVSSPLAPFAFVLLNRTAARAVGLGDKPIGLIRFGGNDAAVRAQIAALSQVSQPQEVETEMWLKVRQLDGEAHSTIRVSSLPRRISAVAGKILTDDVPSLRTCIDPRRGVIRVIAAAGESAGTPEWAPNVLFKDEDQDHSSEVIFEKLPADVWPLVSPTVVNDGLSRRVKEAFDPSNILNPGILGPLKSDVNPVSAVR